MAPEVIACDEDPDATYDNRVSVIMLLLIIKITLCVQLRKVPLQSPLSRHIRKLNCSLLHMTWSNISSTAGASDLNSQHTVLPIKNVFDI